jgi:hypothetical protein
MAYDQFGLHFYSIIGIYCQSDFAHSIIFYTHKKHFLGLVAIDADPRSAVSPR